VEIVGLQTRIKERTMKSNRIMTGYLLGLLLLASPVFAQTNVQLLNIDGIANAMGTQGDLSGGMYKVSFPRSDLNVKVGNVVIKPALALVNWAAFIKSGSTAVTYGDLVLLENEINPVISKLEDRGIEISALHNHLLHENPRIMYVHFMGYGDEVEMAKGIREALALTKTPLVSTPSGPETKPKLAKEIERVIGYEGSMGGGVLHITVPRNDVHVAAMGTVIPGSMGMNTPLNFQLEDNNAAINGDFMLLPAEVNPVIKALRSNGIEVVSVHNHMLDDQPHLFFMHFWAYGDAADLAKGLKAALGRIGE
jgi:biotin operon repressor